MTGICNSYKSVEVTNACGERIAKIMKTKMCGMLQKTCRRDKNTQTLSNQSKIKCTNSDSHIVKIKGNKTIK